MYRKQVRRRRAVLLVLVVLSLVLLSTHFSEGSDGPLHTVERGVATVLGPVEEGAERAFKPARDLIDWFEETFEARGENDELHDEVQDLRERVVEAESAVGENEELRGLLELGRSGGIDGYQGVTARVIGRSPTVWYSTVTIERGSSSGIQADDPVITGDGLVGRITEVTPGHSQVTLITDHRSGVSARVLPDGPSGVITPEVGDPEDLLLDFIPEDKEVKEGKTVVTAGWRARNLASLFPPGIPIGEVTEAGSGEQDAHRVIHVRPFADIREIDLVQVLTEPVDDATGLLSTGSGDAG